VGVGLAFSTFRKRKKRSLTEEESERALNLKLDLAQAKLENNIEAFLTKFHIQNLK
jgi:hypothetical protein